MDDLRYLAQYAPDCFEKTCKNVVYNFPNAKPIMEPAPTPEAPVPSSAEPEAAPVNVQDYVMTEQEKIDQVLNNLKKLEHNEFPQTNVNAREVKDLLGNLFMELLFPHNDRPGTLHMPENDVTSSIDFKV